MSESPVEQTENPLADRLEQLDREIAERVERVVREFRQEMGERVRQSSQEMLLRMEEVWPAIPESFIPAQEVSALAPAPPAPPKAPRGPGVHELLEAVARVDGESTQADILNALLEEGLRFASRTAFFLVRPNEVRGWASQGFDSLPQPIGQLSFEPPADSAWMELIRGDGTVRLSAEECAELGQRLHAPAGALGVLVPFVLRGQIAGALYADCEEGAGAPEVACLQVLSHVASQTLETAAFRGPGGSAALRPIFAPEEPEEPAASEAQLAVEAAEVEPLPEVGSLPEVGPVSEVEAPAPEVETYEPETPAFESPEPAMEMPAPAEPAAEIYGGEAPAMVAPTFEETPIAEPPSFMEPEPAIGFEPAVEAIEPSEPMAEISPPAEEEIFETSEDIQLESLEPDTEVPVSDYGQPAAGVEVGEDSEIWEEEEPTVIGQRAAEEIPMAPPPPISPEAVGQQTVRLDVSALQTPHEAGAPLIRPSEEQTAPIPSMEVEPPTQPEFELEPEAPEDVGFELEPEPEPMLEAPAAPSAMPPTQVQPPADMQVRPPTQVQPPADMPPSAYPSSFAAPPAAAPAAPPPTAAAPAPPAQRPGGGTEVAPPSDLQGPGLAFAAQPASPELPTGEEAALHEEARRLARLLVSEIKLYNEEVIEEGRRAGNIYSRLKEDIDRSRQMYEERIDPRLQGKDDYFHQELVQRLAGGDPKLLGI